MSSKKTLKEYLKENGESSFLYANTTMDKAKAIPGLPEHRHQARMNLYGNGLTDDFTGAFVHNHPIKDGTVQEAMGHTHKLGKIHNTPQDLEKESKTEAGFSEYLKSRQNV